MILPDMLTTVHLRADNLSSKDIKAGLEASQQPVAKSFYKAPVNSDYFESISSADREKFLLDSIPADFEVGDGAIFNALQGNGEFTPSKRVYVTQDQEWLDNIRIPLKNEDNTPKLDEKGNPCMSKAPNPYSLTGRYFVTPKDKDGFCDQVQIAGLLENQDMELEKF